MFQLLAVSITLLLLPYVVLLLAVSYTVTEYYHEGINKANNDGATPLATLVSSAVKNGCSFTQNHIKLIK